MHTYDYIIAGSGIAGLYTAILAKEYGSVLILTKGSIEECNTQFAQGGIAAPIGPGDSPQLHRQDTTSVGSGLCDERSVRILTDEAADRIADLIRFGVRFDTSEGEIALAREGAHSVPRVLHAGGDATGKYIELSLSELARHDGIEIREYSLVAGVLVADGAVEGVRVFDSRTGTSEELGCHHLVLATGGAGRLFQITTNSEVVTGDGVALAFEAGAEVMDMEFFQFHPTVLRLPGAPPFLISEAVRGEGGVLRNEASEPFMTRYHPLGDLAPRDVVSQSIVAEMRRTGADHVYVDVRHLDAKTSSSRFPHIYQFCLRHGLDFTKRPIPVAPAAHYMMGGVKVNTWGETSVPGLLAAGEAACTGAHGANRLASNSLLETVVFAKRMVERTRVPLMERHEETMERVEEQRTLPAREVVPTDYPKVGLAALQRLMWEEVGIERSSQGLTNAANTLAAWQLVLPEPADRPSYDLRNAIVTGRLMAEAALVREESRGAHYRSDFPNPSNAWVKHLVYRLHQPESPRA